nr:XdhC family protein [Sphingomonas oleivorans]
MDRSQHGERTALVTITDVIGSSSRSPGTHMAVSETGVYRGSISGGCVEAAVVGEAKRVIENGQTELLRLGAGSRFIDIRLPCGGGLDLLITPEPSPAALDQALGGLKQRTPIRLALGRDGLLAVSPASDDRPAGWDGDHFVVRHDPELRIVILGHGAETEALAALACRYGADVVILSPDETIVESVDRLGAQSWLLKTPARSPHLRSDKDTAVVTLFHDHDWESELLEQALEQDAFFIGAMGSRRTHALRLAALTERGVPPSSLARITGPIGLIPATRDPDTLALSTLSQIVACHQQRRSAQWTEDA